MKSYFRQLAFVLSICFLTPQPSKGQVGNDNPTGVAGDYNGDITTGGSIDPYTGNAKRFVHDLTVTGSVGKYPLTWTRILNTRGGNGGGFGHSSWGNSYSWGLTVRPDMPPTPPNPYEGPDATVSYPDGRRLDLHFDGPYTYVQTTGIERMDRLRHAGGGNYDLLMADGGRVEFRHPSGSSSGFDLRATAIVDPYEQATTIEYNSAGRLDKITEPGHRYLKISYKSISYLWPHSGPNQIWLHINVTDKVEAFDGRGTLIETVKYDYEEIDVLHFHYANLTKAIYDDTKIATYTYQPSNVGGPNQWDPHQIHFPMVKTCHDFRNTGPMANIEYEYVTRSQNLFEIAWGQVKKEKYPGGPDVTEILYPQVIYPPDIQAFFRRTERRPDTATRVFQYSVGGEGELRSYTDFDTHTSTIAYSAVPGSDNYLKTLTDPRLNQTKIEKEPIAGAVKAVTRGNRPAVRYQYWDDNNPYYLKSKTEQRGKITSYLRYADNHAIEQINYPDNGWEHFTYNSLGQVLAHRMTSGGTEEFTYDLRGLKRTYTPPSTQSDPTPSPTVYTYYENEGDRPDRIDRLKTVTDSLGHTTTYDYNMRGQITLIKHNDNKYIQNDYFDDGTLHWTEDELRHKTTYTYDVYKRVRTVENAVHTTVTNDYTPPNGLSPLSHTTSSIYRTTTFMGKEIEYDYDKNFRRKKTTQAPGTSHEATTTYTYDPAGNLETVTAPEGQPGQLHAGAHTTYGYDDHNRRESVTDALVHTTSWLYDDAGNMTQETRPDTKSRTWDEYDAMNRVKHTIGFLQEPTGYDYDPAGNLIRMTTANGGVYSTEYDELNRKKSATYPLDATNTIRTETWLYDAAGNPRLYKNPAGQYKHFEHDDRNRQWHAYWNLLDSSQTPNPTVGTETTTIFDDASRVTRITTNGGETTIVFGYDDANHKTSEEQSLIGFPTRHVQTDPDNDGNRLSLSVAGVYSFTYDYTPRQQLSHINNGANQYFEYSYDKNGNLKKRQDKLQGMDSTNFGYDVLNRVVLCEQTGANDSPFARSHYDEYDLANNVKSITREEDGNRGERFDYDDANQLKGVSYDATIAPTPTPPPGATPTPPPGATPTPPPGATPTPPPGQSPTPAPPSPTPAATPAQQVAPVEIESEEGPGEQAIVTMHTATGQAAIFFTSSAAGYVLPAHNGLTPGVGTIRYQGPIPVASGQMLYFSAVAYKAGMTDSDVAELYVDNTGGGNSLTPGPRTVTYINDSINRMSMNNNGLLTTYVPNGLNQYTTVTGHYAPLYDSNFNLSRYDERTYVYDADRRLTSAGGAHNAQFVYDGLGRCVKRTIDSVTTVFTYDDWKPVAEWNGAGGLVAWNLYGPGADEILVRYQASTGSYLHYHLDAMGNVQFLLDGNGDLVEKYTYDAFGQPSITDRYGFARVASAYGNRFMFTGREYLSGLGVYDYRHRTYHSGLGRFMQVDPIGFKGDSQNLYRYCRGNPINHSDPMGLYARGAGWSDKDWALFEQSQRGAANAVEKALATTERALANGGKAMEDAKRAYEKAYGPGSATKENLAKIAMVLQRMGEALRDNGEKGYYANSVTDSYMKSVKQPGMAGLAYRSDPKSIYINTERSFDSPTKAGSPDQTRQWLMTHESSHNFGLEDVRGKFGPAYKYSEIPGQKISFERLPSDNPAGALQNADTLTSFAFP